MYQVRAEANGFARAGAVGAGVFVASAAAFALIASHLLLNTSQSRRVVLPSVSSVFWWAQGAWKADPTIAQEHWEWVDRPAHVEKVQPSAILPSHPKKKSARIHRRSSVAKSVQRTSTDKIAIPQAQSRAEILSHPSMESLLEKRRVGVQRVWKSMRRNFFVALRGGAPRPALAVTTQRLEETVPVAIPKEDYSLSSRVSYSTVQKTQVHPVRSSTPGDVQMERLAADPVHPAAARQDAVTVSSVSGVEVEAKSNLSKNETRSNVSEASFVETKERLDFSNKWVQTQVAHDFLMSGYSIRFPLSRGTQKRSLGGVTVSTQKPDPTVTWDQWSKVQKSAVFAKETHQETPPPQPDAPINHVGAAGWIPQSGCEYSKSVRFIEGFNLFEDATVDTQVSCLTHRSAASWRVAKKDQRYHTVFLQDSELTTQGIPLFTQNDVVLMSKILSVDIQKQMGMVVGRVAAGHTVSLSGRSETPLYFVFNPETRSIQRAETTERERFFVVLNVAPGAQMAYLTSSHQGETQSVVAFPVYNETFTYLDLRSLSEGSIRGTVVKAGAEVQAGVAHASISQAGLMSQAVESGKEGAFELQSLKYIRGYPVYLEAVVHSGGHGEFVHRFALDPRKNEVKTLFYFSAQEISSWVDQLEGGVSPESGLLFGAFPRVTSQIERRESLLPEFQSVAQQHLAPEAYTWDKDGKLYEKVEISQDTMKMMVVQISEGAHLLRLKHSVYQDVLWSDFIFASPGVVNVIVD